tara:strand:+ start:459 stop:2285 length:1827 start_codon:yes stop_codon:yes gene_type:complete
MKKILLILQISAAFANSFIPNNNQSINYIQVFFKWPQIPGTNQYQLTIVETENPNQSLSYSSLSNSMLIEDYLNWDTNYSWEVCGVDEYSDICFNKEFTTSSIDELSLNQINILDIDSVQYYDGINILDFESLGYSLAIDKYGNIIWFADNNNFNNSKIISGELLDNGNFTGFSNGVGYEFTIDSDIIFETPSDFNVHHQISKTNQETYFIIDAEIEYHPCPIECDIGFSMLPIPWQGDRFIELNSLGEIIWEWNTFNEISLLEYNPYYAETYNGVVEFDWTHSNSVLYDEISESVYISIRNLSRVTSIDYLTGEVNWNLGESNFMINPDFENEINFSQQHSVQLTDNGNLIFFDNGRFQDPELSRCIEVAFENEEPIIVWEHTLPDSMFTGSRGECDRLANGNTLISAGRNGNVIEVNSNNDLVWHLNVKDNNNIHISVYRTQRVPNLYPDIFSYEIDNLNGDFGDYTIVNNGIINLSIYNHGWIDRILNYSILSDNSEIISGQINLNDSLINYDISLDNYTFNNNQEYIFRLTSSNNSSNSQDINFYFSDLELGDVDASGSVDILDAVTILEIILNSLDYNQLADINNDMNIDVLDIMIIINIIIT